MINELTFVQSSYNIDSIRNIKNAYQNKQSVSENSQPEIEDKAEISDESINLFKQESAADEKKELSPQEEKKIEELKKRDKEVKAHEQAHVAAAGNLVTRGANYQYEQGPDGEKYAVNGDVSISISKEKDPEKTIEKAEHIKRAALAPSSPSSQDIKVAQKAEQMSAEARAEIRDEKQISDKKESVPISSD